MPAADLSAASGDLDGPTARVTRLSGGVSAETVLVEVPPVRIVVKRALDRLLVRGAWRAKPERAMTEAAALELLHGITPDYTPRLYEAHPEHQTVVMSGAPAHWRSWKDVLLGAVEDPAVDHAGTAATLGRVLSTWHDQTWATARPQRGSRTTRRCDSFASRRSTTRSPPRTVRSRRAGHRPGRRTGRAARLPGARRLLTEERAGRHGWTDGARLRARPRQGSCVRAGVSAPPSRAQSGARAQGR